MLMRSVFSSLIVLAALVITSSPAWGIGFVLGESKEELELEYDLSVKDHGTGRVTLVFTLADEGRLKPLDDVQLTIPAQKKNKYGGRWMDLVVSIEMTKTDGGKRVGRVHILKEWAERAEIWLNTHTFDGKIDPLTRLHHVIQAADYIKNPPAEAAKPVADPPAQPPAATPPATDTDRT